MIVLHTFNVLFEELVDLGHPCSHITVYLRARHFSVIEFHNKGQSSVNEISQVVQQFRIILQLKICPLKYRYFQILWDQYEPGTQCLALLVSCKLGRIAKHPLECSFPTLDCQKHRLLSTWKTSRFHNLNIRSHL